MTEMQLHDLRVTVERIEGRSVCGLAVGDYFEVTESSRVRIPDGQALLPVRDPGRAAAAAGQDAPAARGGLARAGQPRLLPGSRGGARDADRAPRRALTRDGGAHIAREIGLGLLGDQLPADYEAIAREAEAAGIDVVSVFHDLLYQPAIGPLLLMARVTERVRLGPAALNPFTLHPYEIAGQTAMLDLASGGRAYLGLVKGAWLDRLGLDGASGLWWHCGKRSRSSRSCLPATRAGSRASGSRSRRGRPSPTSALRPSVPLLIGTWGERTAAWAGTVAAELKIGGSANPELVPVVRGWAGSAGDAHRRRLRDGGRRGRRRGRVSGRGRRWRRTSTSSPVSTRRSSCDPARSRRSIASRSRERPRRWLRR